MIKKLTLLGIGLAFATLLLLPGCKGEREEQPSKPQSNSAAKSDNSKKNLTKGNTKLVETDNKSKISLLTKALESSEVNERLDAVDELGEIASDDESDNNTKSAAILALKKALSDSNEDVRTQAVTALGDVGDTSVIEPLKIALRDKSGDVRVEAVEAIGEIESDESINALAEIINDKSEEVCLAIVDQLSWLADYNEHAVIPILIEMIKNDHEEARLDAADELNIITDQDFEEDYDAWKKWLEKQDWWKKREKK